MRRLDAEATRAAPEAETRAETEERNRRNRETTTQSTTQSTNHRATVVAGHLLKNTGKKEKVWQLWLLWLPKKFGYLAKIWDDVAKVAMTTPQNSYLRLKLS